MKLVLSEQNMTLCGKFARIGTKADFTAKLRDAGATVTASLGARTTLVVLGIGWSTVSERAAQRGLPVINEAQAIKLLKRGELELEDHATPDTTLGEVIGEARALLDGTIDVSTWSNLLELIDRCAPAHADVLADYLNDQLDRWEQPPNARLLHTMFRNTHPLRWLAQSPYGELRVAPPSWVSEASMGKHMPKHKIARAIVLTTLRHSNKELVNIFGASAFERITHLDLGSEVRAKRSQGVFKALAKGPIAPHLKQLRLTSFHDVHAKALSVDTPLELEELSLNLRTADYDAGAVCELMSSSWTANLERLVVEAPNETQFADVVDALPPSTREIERFTVDLLDGFANPFGTLSRSPECQTLELRGTITSIPTHPLAFQGLGLPERTRHLDFSAFRVNPTQWNIDSIKSFTRELFIDPLPQARITAKISRITLGEWRTDALVEEFARQGVEVVG